MLQDKHISNHIARVSSISFFDPALGHFNTEPYTKSSTHDRMSLFVNASCER